MRLETLPGLVLMGTVQHRAKRTESGSLIACLLNEADLEKLILESWLICKNKIMYLTHKLILRIT